MQLTNKFFWKNVGWRGGIANVTTYDQEVLLDAVLKGEIHPGKVFTKSFDLDHVQDAYEAMDQRQAIKSLLKEEAVEIVTQLAFYCGWPKAWSTFPLIEEVYGD